MTMPKNVQAVALSIQWTDHAAPTFIQDMGVDHVGGNIRTAQRFPHGADVVAALREMGGECVTQGMGRDRHRDCARDWGNIVTRSLPPLPSRTVI